MNRERIPLLFPRTAVGAFCATVILALLPSISQGFARNRCAVEQIAGRSCALLDDARGDPGLGDLLVFRSALSNGRWGAVRLLASRIMFRPARIGEALLVRKARRRTRIGDVVAARNALDVIFDAGCRDPDICHAAGDAYEKTGDSGRAEECYRRGLEAGHGQLWSPSRFALGVLYYRQGRWLPVINTLEPLSTSGALQPEKRSLSRSLDWPAAYLLLAHAYEHTDRSVDAKNIYRRVALRDSGALAWQQNRALVSLAALEAREADPSMLPHLAAALDLTLTGSSSYRASYQHDTWNRLTSVLDSVSARAEADRLRVASRRTIELMPRSPGAWLIRSLAATAECDDVAVREAYDRAAQLNSTVTPFAARLKTAQAKSACR